MADIRDSQTRLNAYIPETLLNWYNDAGNEPPHVISPLRGAVVCVDASGFTAMTRRLAERGKLGPELLTSRLNLFFDEMSAAVFERGGDVLKFAGDAFWAYFPDEFAPDSFLGAALSRLKNVNGANDLAREYPLTIHIGAEFGEFWLASLGDPAIRLEIEPVGQIIERVFRLCDQAETNQLVIGAELAERCQRIHNLLPLPGDVFLVEAHYENRSLTERGYTANRYDLPRLSDHLRPYLPIAVAGRLESERAGAELQSEHRDVVVLFAQFEFHSSDATHAEAAEVVTALNSVLGYAFGAVRELGGSISRIDPYLSGHKLLILFGAPVKGENDELMAIACARRLTQLNDERFKIRIGAALGSLFCGDVGASRRREYTVMGECANMAARLMSQAAFGQVLIDGAMRDNLPTSVTTSKIELALKGIGRRVPCFQLTGVSEESQHSTAQTELVGLHAETDRLKRFWDGALQGKRRIVSVTGEPGVGKTSLVRYLCGHIGHGRCGYFSGRNSILHRRGWLAGKVLDHMYGQLENRQSATLEGYVTSTVGAEWSPLLAGLFDLSGEDNEWTKGLSGELRLQKTRRLFARLVESLLVDAQALVIDDCESIDEYSLALLLSLAESSPDLPLLILLICRQSDTLDGQDALDDSVEVEPPSDSEWSEFFTARFSDGKREEEFCSRLLRVSGGNPHIVTGFIGRCVQERLLEPSPLTGKWSLVSSDFAIEPPGSLRDAHLSHFDRLPEPDRRLLKVVAVSYGPASAQLLADVSNDDGGEIGRRLKALSGSHLLSMTEDGVAYEYMSESMREAVYSCIPRERLVELHALYARELRETGRNERADALAYHYERAGVPRESFHFALLAAGESSQVHALNEAARFLRQCRSNLLKNDPVTLGLDGVFKFHRSYASSLILEGKYNEAYPVFREWRRLGKRHNRERECVIAALETSRTLWRQSRYQRSRLIVSRLLASKAFDRNQAEFAAACSVMSDLERRAGNFAGAREWCEKSIKRVRKERDGVELANGHNKLGLALWGAGLLEQAARSFRASLRYGKGRNDNYAQARTLNNLGIIKHALGKYVDSEELLAEALQSFKKIGDIRNESYASGNLANVSRILGKFQRSRALFEQADLIFQKVGDSHAHHYTVGNIGDIDLIEGSWDRAEEKFGRVSKFATSVGDRELNAECRVRFGELAFFTDDMELAEKRYLDAIREAQEIGSKEWRLRASIGLARLYIGERRESEAIELIGNISSTAMETRSVISQNEAAFLSGEYSRIANRPEEATGKFQSAMKYAVANSVFELALKSAVRLYEVDSEGSEKQFALLSGVIDKFISQNSLRQWKTIAASGYLSYFSDGLNRALREGGREEWLATTHTV